MFTGIIEEIGKVGKIVRTNGFYRLTVKAPLVAGEIKPGDSVSVDGVCLTAIEAGKGLFTTEIMRETLTRTTLKDLRTGSVVNLERALTPVSRLGGHFVTGHIDEAGRIASYRQGSGGDIVEIECSKNLLRYITPQGSVAIDGISLTVIEIANSSFTVGIIPHTAASTTLSTKKSGEKVNIETDLLAKYVEKMLESQAGNKEKYLKEFLGG